MSRRLLGGLLLSGSLLLTGCLGPRAATPPPTPAPQQAPKKDDGPFKPYDKVITDKAMTDDGLFTLHRVDDKLYFEIPDSLLGRDLLLISRIAQAPTDLHPFLGGGSKVNEQVVRWQRQDDKILLRVASYTSIADTSQAVYQAVRNSNFEPVVEAFKIEALRPDSADAGVVIDVTKFFNTDVPAIGLPDFLRSRYQVRRVDSDRSFLASAKSFPENVEVRHALSYDAARPPSNGSTNTLSVLMSQSMVLLPAEPMRVRYADDRVGWFTLRQIDFGLDAQKAATRDLLRRWRLEPSDPAAYARGELVEPVKPIVYYLDPGTPEKWRPYFIKGIEDWQAAFETAGFKNAIVARLPPSPAEDPDWSPEDVRFSTVRYVANTTRNATGPSVSDPRSGEIIESDIIWYHNHMRSYRNWYLIQTGGSNPSVTGLTAPEQDMGEMMRMVIAHEVGHALGLPHNMIASSAYPVDSLRVPAFTQRYGVAPTIMDYARLNYIAQPGDGAIRYIRQLGPYDHYAINWGYRVLPGLTPEAERPVLDAWIAEKAGDPLYRFGGRGIDPRSQTEDLGDDAVKASTYGMANLKRVVPNLVRWTRTDGENYDDLEELYGELVGQWNRFVGHVATSVGGVHYTRKAADDDGYAYEVVPEARQREAMAWMAANVFETPTWLADPDILRRIESAGAVDRLRRSQVRWLGALLDAQRLQRLIEAETIDAPAAGDTYTLLEMMDDLRGTLWQELRAGRPIDTYRRNLQRAYLEEMETLMTEELDVPSFALQTRVDISQSDIRPFARGQLRTLRGEVQAGLRRTRDRATRYHLEDVLARIDAIMDPQGTR